MPHYLTDYFRWLFVRRRPEVGRSFIELWRCEEPRGVACLYQSDPTQIIERVLAQGNDLATFEHTLLATLAPYMEEHKLPGRVKPIAVLDRDPALVLNNEIVVSESTDPESRVGRIIYDGVLEAFSAVFEEDRRPFQHAVIEELLKIRHVWALAVRHGTPPVFRLVATDRFGLTTLVRFDREDEARRITFNFNRPSSDVRVHMNEPPEVMEVPEEERDGSWGIVTLFSPEFGRLASALGAVAQCGDPTRFESLKTLIAHTADLGWRARHNIEGSVPVPELTLDALVVLTSDPDLPEPT